MEAIARPYGMAIKAAMTPPDVSPASIRKLYFHFRRRSIELLLA
jgi:hypothetical protein